MEQEKIRELVSQMTLKEKAGMCSGADFWHLKGVERLGIPSVMVTDGPHGLRKQDEAADHLGINDSVKAVCFPAGCATAASFDRAVLRTLGETLGEECQSMGVSAILGPAMNIKRSPLCGRNFEYYSEDPYVSSELAAAMIEGVQSRNVGTSAKHFLANNQEKRRMTNSSEADERTLREIYLASFEGAVKKAKPWTVMSSYNRINGTYVGDSKEYLTEILRNEWGFDGMVLSDWGGVNDRVQALKAGLDLEMPGNGGLNDEQIVVAVQDGSLSKEVLDTACERIVDFIFKYTETSESRKEIDFEKDHETAAQLERESIVLLKNEEDLLPLESGGKVAFIGKYAKKPRYQGGGSSHINSWKVESALEAAKEFTDVIYAKGFEDEKDEVDEKLQAEAVRAAESAETAVIFAGLPDNFESEGYDRTHLELPNCQNQLIEKILEVQKNVIVVLHNGAPVTMPWKDKVKGILEAYLGGQAVGRAVTDILYGKVNPSGRLAETFPLRLEDTPCYLTYGKGRDRAVYQEGVFVGYRHYTSVNREVLFPFGYGLSYTEFAYSDLRTDKETLTDREIVNISVKVKNIGKRTGKEVVQLYVSAKAGETVRPVRELKGFEKIELAPGEEKTVTFTLDMRAFAYWKETIHDWYVEDSEYGIQIAKNAQEILLEKIITVCGTKKVSKPYSMNTCMGELMRDAKAQKIMGSFMGQMTQSTDVDKLQEQHAVQNEKGDAAVNQQMMEAMMEDMPLRQLLSFVPGMKREMLTGLLDALNRQ